MKTGVSSRILKRREGTVNNTERIREQSEKRAKLWREHVASYEKVLDESPEAFSAFCAEFRERYLLVTPDR